MKGERRELTPQMKKRRRKKNIIGFTFILPSLIGFILFMAYPFYWLLWITLPYIRGENRSVFRIVSELT